MLDGAKGTSDHSRRRLGKLLDAKSPFVACCMSVTGAPYDGGHMYKIYEYSYTY